MWQKQVSPQKNKPASGGVESERLPIFVIIIAIIIKPPITNTNTVSYLDMQALVAPTATIFVPKMNTLFHNRFFLFCFKPLKLWRLVTIKQTT